MFVNSIVFCNDFHFSSKLKLPASFANVVGFRLLDRLPMYVMHKICYDILHLHIFNFNILLLCTNNNAQ